MDSLDPARTSPTIPRQLGLIVLFFAVAVVCLLGVVFVSFEITSGVRAYVRGEGLWSKAQKLAVIELEAALNGDPGGMLRFQEAVAVPLGDRLARRELQKPRPDLHVATAGFIAGRNHPDDVPSMVLVFRRLQHAPHMARAIVIWSAADRELGRLIALASHVARAAGAPPEVRERVRRKLRLIDQRLTPLEDAFSATLGAGARMVNTWLFATIVFVAGLLVALGGALSRLFIRSLRNADAERRRADEAVLAERRRAEAALAAEARVASALARIGWELISSLDRADLFERLCQLTAEVLGGEASATIAWDAKRRTYESVALVGRGATSLVAADRLEPPDRLFIGVPVAAIDDGLLAIALKRGAEIVGVQVVRARERFDPEHRRIAEGIAAVASMALANAHLVARLEEASRLKSEFVSTMSHELRTPLNVVLGYTEMVREVADEAQRTRLLDRIELAARDLLELIESTLEIGRIEVGRDVPQLEPVCLPALLGTIGQTCERFPRRPGVVLHWPDDVPEVGLTTDPRKLTVVLRNLIGNALKFTETGWVRLDIVVAADAVTLRVRDTGVGIQPEDQTHIFEMFRQGDGSDRRRFGGTGLGLFIVRRFVGQLGGTITVESVPAAGSSFTVTLPLHAVPASAARAA